MRVWIVCLNLIEMKKGIYVIWGLIGELRVFVFNMNFDWFFFVYKINFDWLINVFVYNWLVENLWNKFIMSFDWLIKCVCI